MDIVELDEYIPDLWSLRKIAKEKDIILKYKGIEIFVLIDPKKYAEQNEIPHQSTYYK